MQLNFNVKQQTITLESTDIQVVAESKNYLYCSFSFSEDWHDVIKTAIFISAKGDVFNVILEDDTCIVPWEVIKYPHFSVSVFGGDLITTNKVVVNVSKSGYSEGETPKDPTPDVYAQILKMIEEMGGQVDEEVIRQAVYEYLEENPVDVPDETDPTVPEWAKQPNKPTYTPDEIGTLSATAITEKITQTVDEETQIIKADIEGIQEDIKNESHFRGYVSTNAKIQEMEATPNDFAYSAESGTVWVYDAEQGWEETDTPVPDKGTPLSNAAPLINGVASSGTSEEGARSDHRHPTDTTRLGVVEFNEFKSELETSLDNIITKYGLDGDVE